jgi:hypothetical protein
MAKRIIAALLLVCILGGMLAGCTKEKITAEQAYQIVLKDLGAAADKAEAPHIHEGTYEEKPCFNIYITVDGMNLQYIISDTGKILSKGPGTGHSH